MDSLRNRAGWITLALGGYFFLIMIGGLLGLLDYPVDVPIVLLITQPVTDVFHASSVVVGIAGQMAILLKSRRGEFVALIAMSVLTFINGLLLLPTTTPSGVRLIAAPLMMLSFGWYRLQYTLTKKDVRFLHRTFDTEEGWSDSTATGFTGDQPDEE